MKRFFIILFSTAILSFSGCASGTASNNSNQTIFNANSPVPNAQVVENAQTNSNLTNIASSSQPVPKFTDAQTAFAEGKKLLDTNEIEKAVEAFEQAVRLDPDLAEAHFNLGIAYALIEDEMVDETVAEESPKKSRKRKETVKLTPSEKAFTEAARSYEKITKKNPKDDAAFFNLGRSYNKLNKDKEAQKALRQAVKLKPDDTEYNSEFGAILIKLAQYDEAVGVLKKAVKLDSTNSQAEERLEKAIAGQKRINFGVNKKLNAQQK